MVLTLNQFVGWAKARLRRAHHRALRKERWARYALPTLRNPYSVTCLSPHCLQTYLTRVAPFSA